MAQVLRHPFGLIPGPLQLQSNQAMEAMKYNGGGNANELYSLVIPHPPTTATFVKKLFELVNNEPDDLVCWVQNGTAFEIKDPKKLEKTVLPKYFRHSKFKSFARQLCFYSFKNVSQGKRSWIYKHELFRQGHPELLDLMRRRTASGASKHLADTMAAKALAVVNAQQAAASNSKVQSHVGLSEAIPSIQRQDSRLAPKLDSPFRSVEPYASMMPLATEPASLNVARDTFSSPRNVTATFSTPRLATATKRPFEAIDSSTHDTEKFKYNGDHEHSTLSTQSTHNFAHIGPTASPERNKKLTTSMLRKRDEGKSFDNILDGETKSESEMSDRTMFNDIIRYTDLLNDTDILQLDVAPLDSVSAEPILNPTVDYDEYLDIYGHRNAAEQALNKFEPLVLGSSQSSDIGLGFQSLRNSPPDTLPLSPLADDISSWLDDGI